MIPTISSSLQIMDEIDSQKTLIDKMKQDQAHFETLMEQYDAD